MTTVPAGAFHTFFEKCHEPLLLVTSDGKVVDANLSACTLLRMPADEIPPLRTPVPPPGEPHEIIWSRNDGTSLTSETTRTPLDDDISLLQIRPSFGPDLRSIKKSLQETEERYRILASSTMEGVAIHEDGRILFCNSSFASMFGYAPDEVVGMPPITFIAPHAQKDAVGRVAAGYSAPYRSTGIRKDGSTFPVEFHGKFLEGSPRRVGLVRDLSAQKQAEEELRASEERYRQLIENLNAGVIVFAPDTSIMLCNRTSARLLDLSIEQMVGRRVSDPAWRFVREDRTEMPIEEHPARRVIETMAPVVNQMVGVNRPNGELVWILANGFPMFEAGGLKHVVVTFIDVSDRKNAEEAARQACERVEKLVEERTEELRQSETLLRTTLETLPVGVAVVNAAGATRYINHGAVTLWGEERNVTLGEYDEFRLFYHGSEEPVPSAEMPVSRVLTTGLSVQGEIYDIRAFSGEKKIISISAAPLHDEADTIFGAVAVMEDITRQQELQKQLLHSQKLESIGSLAGGVAHDFNNLLMAICGFTEVVYGELADEGLRENLLHVLEAGKRGRDLAQKLLVFSRQQVTERRVINLSGNVENMLKFVSRLLGENISVRFRLSPQPLNARANSTQIDQVLMNLILNARDAMPDGGDITIATGRETPEGSVASTYDLDPAREYAFIRISDTGTGIQKDAVERIFDPYFTTKASGKGSGLGLSIVHGIIRQHGGGIAVRSAAGEGTSFTIYLPLAQEAEMRAEEGMRTPPAGSERILVVEDDETVLTFLTTVLSREGYQVLQAENAAKALEIVAMHEIDAIFSDVMMPGKNGVEMYAEMKQTMPGLKAIFASGYSSDIMTRTGVDRNDCRFLQKPVSRLTLLQAVREVLDT